MGRKKHILTVTKRKKPLYNKNGYHFRVYSVPGTVLNTLHSSYYLILMTAQQSRCLLVPFIGSESNSVKFRHHPQETQLVKWHCWDSKVDLSNSGHLPTRCLHQSLRVWVISVKAEYQPKWLTSNWRRRWKGR